MEHDPAFFGAVGVLEVLEFLAELLIGHAGGGKSLLGVAAHFGKRPFLFRASPSRLQTVFWRS